MSANTIWWAVAGMAAANFVVRYLPIAAVSRLRLPAPLMRWLSFIPVTVMAALVSVEVLRPGGIWLSPAANPFLLAAVPTGFVYHRTRSFLGTTVAGIAFYLVLRHLLGGS